MAQFFERRGKLFRMQGDAEERFDEGSWSDVGRFVTDQLFAGDTETDRIDEESAREKFPEAFE